jgi:hypothetical protein
MKWYSTADNTVSVIIEVGEHIVLGEEIVIQSIRS